MNHFTTAVFTCMLSLGFAQMATAQSASLCKDKYRTSDNTQKCAPTKNKSASLCKDKHCSPNLDEVSKKAKIQRWDESDREASDSSKVYSQFTVDENGKKIKVDLSMVRIQSENGMHFEYRYIDIDDVRVYSAIQDNLEEDLEIFSPLRIAIEKEIRAEKKAPVYFRE